MKNKILDILKDNYQITDDIKDRVDQLLECMQDDNEFYTLKQIMVWFNDRLDRL